MKYIYRKKILSYLFLIAFPILFLSCDKNDSPIEPVIEVRGQVVSATSLGISSVSLLQTLVNSQISGQQNVTLQYDVETFKIIYRTIDPSGKLVTASGALSIPKGKNNLSIISLHHGTVTSRTQVPSQSLYSSYYMGPIAASLGYYALEPDYLGLGESNLLHPYHYQKSSAEAVIDFIRACKNYAATKGITLNGQVFLAGYSEGGYVTLAAHKEIEQNYKNEITVTASSPMAGAYDLNLTARTILQKSTYNQPAYLSFFFVAYNSIYNWGKINDVFNSPYAEKITSLFDGTKTTDQINSSLTSSINLLFKQSFIASYLNGNETAITSAFANNSLLNWTPTAPIRFYHGNADEYVPYENSTSTRDYFKAHGANVELVTINGGTHVSSAVPSILDAILWFESIRLKKQILAVNNY